MHTLVRVLCVFCFLSLAAATACSKNEKTAATGPAAETATGANQTPVSAASAEGGAPEFASASLYPEKPTAVTQLIAQYALRDPAAAGNYSLVFRWVVDNVAAQEGPVGTLDPGKYVKGSVVYAEITPSNQWGAGATVKTNAVTIGNLPPTVSSVRIGPIDPPAGALLTAAAEGADPDGDKVVFTYQWHVNGKPITEWAKSAEFSSKGLRKKDMVYAVARPSDDVTTGEIKASDVMVLANSAPLIGSVPPYDLQNGSYRYQVKASDPDGDRLSFRLLKAPSGMTIDAATGLIEWKIPAAQPERQEVAIKLQVDDGDGGTADQEYSIILENK